MDVGTAITSAFSAGISMYGVIAALGIAARLDVIDGAGVLERPIVIGIALALFALEFVIDKMPVIDTVWDGVHAVLRPAAGAVILAVTPDQPLPPAVAIGLGAALAFTSHSAKSSTRLLVNTSPEPVSNAVVSTLEDGLVAGLMVLAFSHPAVAFAVTVVLVGVAIGVIVVAWRVVRRVRRRVRGRGDAAAPGGSPPTPGPAPPPP